MVSLDFNQLKEDQYIKDWLSDIGAKKNTRNLYIESMKVYTKFLNKTPKQIILESEEDIKTGKLMRERRISKELRDFRELLENSGIAPLTIKSRLTGVRSFYRKYGIFVPDLPRSANKARPQAKNRDIPEKEDIRDILKVADPLEKAIVLTGVSSGLAVNEISNLKLQEFLDGYDPETEITTLHLIREKVNYEFYTFLSPEASIAIKEYLEYRERTSENKDKRRQERLLKQRINYDKKGKAIGYLFISRYINKEYLKTKNEELRKLDANSIQKIYRELNEKARKSSPSGERNLVRSHNMRKFFNSTLLNNKAELFFTEFLMGHQLDGTRDAYFRADPKSLKEEYKNFIPYLTIQQELSVDDSPEFQRLKTENQNFATSLARATVEKDEIIKLRNEIDELKKKKDEASEITKEYLLSALQDPEIQESLLKNFSK